MNDSKTGVKLEFDPFRRNHWGLLYHSLFLLMAKKVFDRAVRSMEKHGQYVMTETQVEEFRVQLKGIAGLKRF